jgi:pilus assembly protein Flp/PilA
VDGRGCAAALRGWRSEARRRGWGVDWSKPVLDGLHSDGHRDWNLRQFDFKRRGIKMKDMLLKMYVKAQILHEDYGQDLIEYALVVALIAFAATAGMSTVANQINVAFSNIGSKVTSYVS